jgi:hypothetical protein
MRVSERAECNAMERTDADTGLHGVFSILVNGIRRAPIGSPVGVVFVCGNEANYVQVSEFPQALFRVKLQKLLDEGRNRVFYVVERRDDAYHVLAYPRELVYGKVDEEYRRVLTQHSWGMDTTSHFVPTDEEQGDSDPVVDPGSAPPSPTPSSSPTSSAAHQTSPLPPVNLELSKCDPAQ